MKILFIRHGTPDYSTDSLTERGKKEAKLLAERLVHFPIQRVYCSPLGRARETASYTLAKLGMEAESFDWLREFWPIIDRPDRNGEKGICWDWRPADWMTEPDFYDWEKWTDVPVMAKANVREAVEEVYRGFDALMAKEGYVFDGTLYRAERPHKDTIAVFAHFGIECVILSRFMKISPMALWHNFMALPTSVTTLVTEERVPGQAMLRCIGFGDMTHLEGTEVQDPKAGLYRECGTDEREYIGFD